MEDKKFRILKLSKAEKDVLRKIKNRQVQNIEKKIMIGGVPLTHPKTGKTLTASYVNLSNYEASQFQKLGKKGLITAHGKTPYFTNFRLTEKGKFQLKSR